SSTSASKSTKLFKYHFSQTNTSIISQLTNNNLYVIQLLQVFGNKMDKTIILKTWKQFNQIYLDTLAKLKEISSTYDISKLRSYGNNKKIIMEENNELKIMREMCLYILWNIISHPKLLNNTNVFYQILKRKCYRFNVNVNIIYPI
ncbi:hypothetical protein RFI_35262, partial [Reticulomyxa filosa]